jgi:hypothetical protein
VIVRAGRWRHSSAPQTTHTDSQRNMGPWQMGCSKPRPVREPCPGLVSTLEADYAELGGTGT